ncbi:MAG TPA: AbrB/MazE/SpoVT family DNA-binding domain-containing protein [Chloroflexota bacterium]|jgi:bifunctional DNA-binding transcriptional regulator/antitoxin component of YhaV-PrlF toxin-antitoxin module
MALAKVLGRGQVTLPRAVRGAAGVRPGDTVLVRVTGPGTITLEVLPRMTLADSLARYAVAEPVDVARLREEAAADQAEEALAELRR